MQITVISLFPAIFDALNYGVIGRARKSKLFEFNHINPRDYGIGAHRQVDDKPYGGGPGMVMMAEPLLQAIAAARAFQTPSLLVHLSPQGIPLNQNKVRELSEKTHLILLAGRYEGIDERVVELAVDEEISLGDYVVSAGDFPALMLIDAVVRLLPNVLGDSESLAAESFQDHLLDFPHYTRPEVVAGKRVPEVLLSGNHQAVLKWRQKQALIRTKLRRPDLLAKHSLTDEEKQWLRELGEKNVENY